ncbi:MAG: alpha-2-macroglobulin, partial [Rhizobacter sp.]|nr:alpha-2-macroglobulin [Rhizobacter sp.]
MGAIKLVWGNVSALLGQVLGVWNAPPWLRWSTQRTRQVTSASGAALKRHPRLSAALAAGVVAVGVAGYHGHAWWKARPKPVEVSLAVNGPAITDFANGGLPQGVVVSFNESVAPLSAVGKAVEAGISVTPPVAGSWKWLDDRRLAFEPKSDWPVGVDFKATMARELFAPQMRLATYDFAFSSAPFAAKVRKAEFYQDPVNPAVKKGVFELNFSHPVSPPELEKRIELRLADQAEGVLGVGRETTAFTISYDKLKLNAYVHSAQLAVPKEATQLTMAVDKGVVAQLGGKGSGHKLSQSITVPGQYGLGINDVNALVVTNERFEPEHVLVINTSQLVHERELAKNVSAWVLPLKNPSQKPEEQGEEPYPWSDPKEITDKLLAVSTQLVLTPVPSERDHTQTHSFKLRADVGRIVYVQIEPKFKSFGGYLMRDRAQRFVTMPPYPPELRILSEGALLPM